MHQGHRFVLAALMAIVPAAAQAKVDPEIVAKYEKALVGKNVVANADIKVIKILKQVRGDQRSGGVGGENLEQTKDATVVSEKGIAYASEARSKEYLFAPKGSTVGVTSIEFGRSTVEIEVKSLVQDQSTVITFEFEEKLDEAFSAKETFRKMLAMVFVGEFVP